MQLVIVRKDRKLADDKERAKKLEAKRREDRMALSKQYVDTKARLRSEHSMSKPEVLSDHRRIMKAALCSAGGVLEPLIIASLRSVVTTSLVGLVGYSIVYFAWDQEKSVQRILQACEEARSESCLQTIGPCVPPYRRCSTPISVPGVSKSGSPGVLFSPIPPIS